MSDPIPPGVRPESTTFPAGTVVVEPAGGRENLLTRLLDGWVILPEEWQETQPALRDELNALADKERLLARLADLRLLTPFQVEAVRRGVDRELVLGQYRLLEPIGQGGMGTVYRAEHVHLRRQVAIKVMSRTVAANPRLLHRFYGEARAVAKLQHPHIVACLDAGRHVRGTDPQRDYYVMELIPGSDLQHVVRTHGPLTPARVCDLFRMIAEALAEAHRLGLVHRDIKPSNILITPDWQAKLLDFGLALQPHHRTTEPGTLLGTVGYMAPEQIQAPHLVDARADLFSLGATMYWSLTGREPYPESGNILRDVTQRMAAGAVEVHRVRPEVPVELTQVVLKLTDLDPDKRYQSARALAGILGGLAKWVAAGARAEVVPDDAAARVLIVDDDPPTRAIVRAALSDCECTEAIDGRDAWVQIDRHPFDLVILDANLPGLSGSEVLSRIRESVPDEHRPRVMMVSGVLPAEALGGLLLDGADDYLEKPFALADFRARVRRLLVRTRRADAPKPVSPARAATVRVSAAELIRRPVPPPPEPEFLPIEIIAFTACRFLQEIGVALPGYQTRLGRYIRALAAAVPERGEYARLKDERFIDLLVAAAPAHDVGLLVVPSSVLQKPDRLDANDIAVLQTHTILGGQVLLDAAARYAAPAPDLTLAAEVSRHHHERWDGSGYPDGLTGTDIPIAARIVAIVSAYEALRTRRPHRPPLTHSSAVRLLMVDSPGEYDPHLVAALQVAAPQFSEICHVSSR